jgi:hypothetical protein
MEGHHRRGAQRERAEGGTSAVGEAEGDMTSKAVLRSATMGFLVAYVAVGASMSWAQTAAVQDGLTTGNNYRALPTTSRESFVVGLIDGMLLAPMFGAPRAEMAWLEHCLRRTSGGQAIAIVEKFMKENPKRWGESMHVLAYGALRKACVE